jgi:hypothetical protein
MPVATGVRTLFAIDSKKVGYAASVNASENISYEPLEVLNLIEVKEFVPTGYNVSLGAQAFRIVNNSLKQQGIFPKEDNILTSGVLECALIDTPTGHTISLFQNCKCASHSWDVTARGIVSESIEFNATRCVDESELPL